MAVEPGVATVNNDGTFSNQSYDIISTKAKITGAQEPEIPENNIFANSYTAENVLNSTELGTDTAVNWEDGTTESMDVEWSLAGVYDATPGATNTFVWTVKAGEYEQEALANGAVMSGTVEIRNKESVIEYTATDYAGVYDSQPHGIEVTVTDPADATVTYSTDGTTFSANNPEYVNVGTYTVYYKIEKANYITEEGSETVVIEKKDVTVIADDQTILKGESIYAEGYVVNGLASADIANSVVLVPSTSEVTGNGTVDITTFIVINGSGADVTSNYNVTLVPGKLVIKEVESSEPTPDTSEPSDNNDEQTGGGAGEAIPAPPSDDASKDEKPSAGGSKEEKPSSNQPKDDKHSESDREEKIVDSKPLSPDTGEIAIGGLSLLFFGVAIAVVESLKKKTK